MNYENRKYLIIPVSQLSQINFDEVLETSAETVRKSVDESKTFVKWERKMPQSLVGISGAEGPYTHEEILAILSGEDWTPTMEEL
jgi:hypothetical protein